MLPNQQQKMLVFISGLQRKIACLLKFCIQGLGYLLLTLLSLDSFSAYFLFLVFYFI